MIGILVGDIIVVAIIVVIVNRCLLAAARMSPSHCKCTHRLSFDSAIASIHQRGGVAYWAGVVADAAATIIWSLVDAIVVVGLVLFVAVARTHACWPFGDYTTEYWQRLWRVLRFRSVMFEICD